MIAKSSQLSQQRAICRLFKKYALCFAVYAYLQLLFRKQPSQKQVNFYVKENQTIPKRAMRLCCANQP